jgi:hypothetical protein
MDFADLALNVLGKVVPWALRGYYTVGKYSSLIDIDISSQGDGFTYQHYNQEATCWFQITNRSPFDITVDRLEAGINLNGYGSTAYQLIPISIPAASKARIYARGILLAPSLENVQAIKKAPQVSINLRIFIRSRVRDFVFSSHLSDLRNVSINCPQ